MPLRSEEGRGKNGKIMKGVSLISIYYICTELSQRNLHIVSICEFKNKIEVKNLDFKIIFLAKIIVT
jgi:hypothetical protein